MQYRMLKLANSWMSSLGIVNQQHYFQKQKNVNMHTSAEGINQINQIFSLIHVVIFLSMQYIFRSQFFGFINYSNIFPKCLMKLYII